MLGKTRGASSTPTSEDNGDPGDDGSEIVAEVEGGVRRKTSLGKVVQGTVVELDDRDSRKTTIVSLRE
jgi:hypothetical protein